MPMGLLLLFAVLAAWLVRLARVPAGGYLELNPRRVPELFALGLHTPEDFLGLGGLIIAGHRDRNVARRELRLAGGPATVYLKREHRVSWLVRLASWWAGFGW